MSWSNAASALAILLVLAAAGSVRAQELDSIDVYTGVWPPYVEAGDGRPGSVADVVRVVFDDMGYDARLRRLDFAYAYHRMETGRGPAAFPYFRTEDRIGEVLFSAPLFETTSRIYFNRRHLTEAEAASSGDRRLGTVRGYRYGDPIDARLEGATVYASEPEAIAALLNGEIDLLPMTERVAAAILERDFPDEAALVRPLPDIVARETVHVIAPDTEAGAALIAAFDASLERLRAAGVISAADPAIDTPSRRRTVARVVASDRAPVVLGRDADGAVYALPQGTRVAVLEWSGRLQGPMTDDRLFQTMTEASLVLALDGPQAGRELYVENMHLAISE